MSDRKDRSNRLNPRGLALFNPETRKARLAQAQFLLTTIPNIKHTRRRNRMNISRKTTFQCNCSTFHWNPQLDRAKTIDFVAQQIHHALDAEIRGIAAGLVEELPDGSARINVTTDELPLPSADLSTIELANIIEQTLGPGTVT